VNRAERADLAISASVIALGVLIIISIVRAVVRYEAEVSA
jgi:hypothetical protein